MNVHIEYRSMVIEDYEPVALLWRSGTGVRLRDSDSESYVRRLLERNPDLSFIAHVDGLVVGAVMAGYDGRRGYIYHLTVDQEFRRCGVGKTLVNRVTDALALVGVFKCLLVVMETNESGKEFWRSIGWQSREDLLMFERTAPGRPNA